MPRSLGHRAGMESLHNIVREAHRLGVEALSVYAFSTENWQRPVQEVNALFALLVEYFNKEIDELDANGVRIIALGDIAPFPERVRACMLQAIERTKDNTGLRFCIAINYGSRAEILRACRQLIEDGAEADSVTEEAFESKLYTAGLPPLDLIIRTAGEQRLSNFLLWQAAYAEFVFTDVLWPDFTPEVFIDSLKAYLTRTRRFGKVVE